MKLISILQLGFCWVIFVVFVFLVVVFWGSCFLGFFAMLYVNSSHFFYTGNYCCCLPAEAEENEPRVFESEMIVRDNMYLDVTLSMCSCILNFQACMCWKFFARGTVGRWSKFSYSIHASYFQI